MWDDWVGLMRLNWHMMTDKHRKHAQRMYAQLKKAMETRDFGSVTVDESALLEQIRETTTLRNQNNLTRTKAYLDFYFEHPEVHWSLLAHVVSRNGGWGMTDVRGEWFAHAASEEESHHFFQFLERANWLIFNDAYPQLLLYESGKKQQVNLSRLLPFLQVSKFMIPMWNNFWATQNSELLTRALIINEQNYIQSRVLEHPTYQHKVLNTVAYQLQSLLNLNQVIVPWPRGSTTRVAGTTVRHFVSVQDRIATGIRLYKILFQDKVVHQTILRWMRTVPHTGSRQDYWPEFFSCTRSAKFSEQYEPKLVGKTSSQRKIYSPMLESVWPDVQHPEAEPGDWFTGFASVIHLFAKIGRQPTDFTHEHIENLKTVENLIVAKDKVKSLFTG